MKKITELTPEQIALFPKYVEKWLKIGLSTEPTNKEKASFWINEAYKSAGLTPPKHIVFCGSPLSAILTAKIVSQFLSDDKKMNKIFKKLKIKKIKNNSVGNSVVASVMDSVVSSVWASVGPSVGNSVWDSVRDSVGASVRASVVDSVRASVSDSVWASVRVSVGASVWNSVWNSVWASIGNSVGNSVGDSVVSSVWASVWASVWDSVRASVSDSVRVSVWDSVRASVWDSVGASVRDSVGASVREAYHSNSVWNQHDSGWYSFCEYFYDVLSLSKQVEKQIPLMRLAEHANWMYPYQNFCFVSEKPEICKLENGVIHAEGGPCIKYRDGFSIYALNGVRMLGNEWVVTTPKEDLDPEKIMAIKNVEQRLMAIKKCGIERILSKLESKVIDKKGGEYRLLEVTIEGSREKLLEMQNQSEDKKHYEFLPPEIGSVEEGLAWRCGVDKFTEPAAKT